MTRTSRGRRVASISALAALAGVIVAAATAATNARVAIKTPGYPIFAVGAGGAVWVGTHHEQVVYRISPKTNRVVKTIIVGHTPCGEPVVGFGAIFFNDCLDEGDRTLELATRSNKIVRTYAGGTPVVGYGSVWTLDTTGKSVRRFDPQTGVKIATIATGLTDENGGGEASLGTAGAGSVWLSDQLAKTVVRIDAATNKVVAVIPLPGAATQAAASQGYAAGGPMTFAGGKAWVGNPAGVYAVDPATNTAALLRVKIGALNAWGDIAITSAGGSVFARTSGNTVTQIDAASGNVVGTYPAAGGGGGIAKAFGSLWVANAASDSVWREPLP